MSERIGCGSRSLVSASSTTQALVNVPIYIDSPGSFILLVVLLSHSFSPISYHLAPCLESEIEATLYF